MRIGLYLEHGVGEGVGGAELMLADLAALWAKDHEVDLIHHRPPLTLERLAARGDGDYRHVRIRCLPRSGPAKTPRNPVRRYIAARDWHKSVSEGYDLFVNCTHWVPCFCHARVGVLLVLFPFFQRPDRLPEGAGRGFWKRWAYRMYSDFEWQRRIGSYTHFIAISEYARRWSQVRWNIDCEVIYPPVRVSVPLASKERLIASVGRFSTRAHSKKQLEMMWAFRQFHPLCPGWTSASVGGLNSREENHAYFDRVRQAGEGYPIRLEANVGRASLEDLLARSRVFWHATGFGDDTDARPELAEHFGISTVEAMAAGAVPVVINKGAQSEIVQHGRNGFLWNTLDELVGYSRLLAEHEGLWQRMSEAARRRAQDFSRERFFPQMSARCGVPTTASPGEPSGDAGDCRVEPSLALPLDGEVTAAR